MAEDEDSRFERMRLEVLREVDKVKGEIDRDVTEIKTDIKNLKWFFGIAFAALFAIFSTMVGLLAYLGNIF